MKSLFLTLLACSLFWIDLLLRIVAHIAAALQAVLLVSQSTQRRPSQRRPKLSRRSDQRPFMQQLSNEILAVVFEMVKENDKTDLVSCSTVCRRWHALVTPILWRTPEPLYPKPATPSPIHIRDKQLLGRRHYQLYDMFPVHIKKYGHSVRSLTLTHVADLVDNRSLQYIVRHCPHLTELRLDRCNKITSDGFRTLAESVAAPQLRTLAVHRCRGFSDRGLEHLAKTCTVLQELVIVGCSGVTDNGVRAIVLAAGDTLSRISLRACFRVTGSSIRTIARTCRSGLHSLDIARIHVPYEDLEELTQWCPNITELNLSRDRLRAALDLFVSQASLNPDNLSRLSSDSREHLSLKSDDPNKLVELIALRLTKLRHLELSYWTYLTDQAIRALSDHAHNLTYLGLVGCSMVDIDAHDKRLACVVKSSPSRPFGY